MRFKRKMMFIATLPMLLSASSESYVGTYFISENVLYKITGDKNATIKIFVYNPSMRITTYTINAYLHNDKTGALLYSSEQSGGVNLKGRTFSFDLPIRYKVTSDGLRFSFTLRGGKILANPKATIYPYVKSTINAITYKNSVYQTSNSFIKLENKEIKTGETFAFNDYNEFLSKNKNNTIDFSSAKMQFIESYDFLYEDCEYHIKDYRNVYPNLSKVNDEIVLKMKCIQNDQELSFELDEEMYVNPTTLEMSSVKLANYEATNNLYIPMGKEQLLEENDSYILIKEAGYSAIDIKLPFTYYFSKSLLGLCYNSEYCIQGGVRQ